MHKLRTLWSITLRKISKIAAIRCQILRLKCTKFDFRWSSAPDGDPWGAYSAPLAKFNGPTSKGGRKARKGRGSDGK